MKVAKFGGSSLATAEQIQKVCNIVQADPDRRIVVVSAPGKRHNDDIKVTDLLIACADVCIAKENPETQIQAILERYGDIQKRLELPARIVEEIETDLRARAAMDTADRELFMDSMKAAGEDNNAKLVAEALRKCGVEAHYMNPRDAGMLLSDEYGNAQVLPQSYNKLKKALSDAPGVTVFPGFFGYTADGAIATFPRGGSDITGAILAAAVGADLYENFTDVDSVFAADPRVVDNARAIDELTYREMRELSYAGFGVFHDEAVLPAVQAQVPIAIKNTNRPAAPGTRVVPSRSFTAGEVVGIASEGGFCSIRIDKYLMNREIGFARRLLQIVEDEGLSLEHAPSGIDTISVIVEREAFYPTVQQRVLDRIRTELEPDDVSVEDDLALLMIVGEGMSHAVGVAAKATAAFAASGVNIEMINQGSSEISMMFGLKETDRAAALRALYDAFFNDAEAGR